MELFGLFGHHPVRLFVGEPCGVVAARPRVVERGLVGAQVHVDALRGEAFPQVDDVALVGERYGLLLFACPADAGDELVQRSVHLVYPALRMARVHGLRIDFGDDAHHAGDDARFGLGARHAAQARRYEEHPGNLPAAALLELLACGVEHGNGRTVHDALRADVHVRTGRHLAVLRDAHRVIAFPVVLLGVVGNHHAVGDDDPRRILVRGEQSLRVAGVHDERLLVGHFRKVFHGEAVLRPVLEYGAVASVGYQFVRMLRHRLVEVVVNHQHDGGCLPAAGGVLVYRPRVHFVVGPQAVHVNPAVAFQFVGEFGGQFLVVFGREVAQCVLYGEFLLFRSEYVLPFGRMVDGRVVRFRCRQDIRNTGPDVVLEFF